MQFPIPPPLEYFDSERLKRNLDREISHELEMPLVIFNPKWQVESMLSKAITTAWDLVPAAWRDLMLFCWGGVKRNGYYKPWLAPVSNEEAKEILRAHFRGQFGELEAVACELYEGHCRKSPQRSYGGIPY